MRNPKFCPKTCSGENCSPKCPKKCNYCPCQKGLCNLNDSNKKIDFSKLTKAQKKRAKIAYKLVGLWKIDNFLLDFKPDLDAGVCNLLRDGFFSISRYRNFENFTWIDNTCKMFLGRCTSYLPDNVCDSRPSNDPCNIGLQVYVGKWDSKLKRFNIKINGSGKGSGIKWPQLSLYEFDFDGKTKSVIQTTYNRYGLNDFTEPDTLNTTEVAKISKVKSNNKPNFKVVTYKEVYYSSRKKDCLELMK